MYVLDIVSAANITWTMKQPTWTFDVTLRYVSSWSAPAPKTNDVNVTYSLHVFLRVFYENGKTICCFGLKILTRGVKQYPPFPVLTAVNGCEWSCGPPRKRSVTFAGSIRLFSPVCHFYKWITNGLCHRCNAPSSVLSSFLWMGFYFCCCLFSMEDEVCHN